MTEKKVYFITGAGRGMGVDIAKAALAAGHAVVATGRNPEKVAQAIGEAGDLLVVTLDITDPAASEAAVQAAVERFGRIDVLVNNAGNFIAGFFEEISPEQFRWQIETNLFGPMNITRAALPVMRRQRSGLVLTVSSSTAAPFRIRTMVVEPGFFRTDLLTPESTDYAERTRLAVSAWNGMNGRRGGDPARLADAPARLAGEDQPPLLGSRRRRRRGCRAEGEGSAGTSGRPQCAVLIAGLRADLDPGGSPGIPALRRTCRTRPACRSRRR
ncbi:SDR family NAD(P)-dependent oxidoreductase [Arthrobacter sp. UYCu712]|uniref:SDR family NAD(P)-dependent oxidoreductase n=1 Tax=Arthrobacter sp. UYCu712 TaxID=3156340 RepID=UPI00339497E1